MSFFSCCESKKSTYEVEVVQTFDKIMKSNTTSFTIDSVEKMNSEQPKLIVKRGQMPVPKNSEEYKMLTVGALSNYTQRQIKKSRYEQIVNQFKGKKQKWTDPEFPPQNRSWSRKNEQARWKRVGEIIENPIFESDNFTPADILQGQLGNCYFLSAIAGIAEKPNRIKKIFPNTDINPNGIYMAKILFRGVYQEVIVDDYFPCTMNGRLLGAQPAGGRQIWVMILEKCWAKLHGSYNAIDGGFPNEALHAFSAAPTDNYRVSEFKGNLNDLFDKMNKADSMDEIVCCGTQPENCQGKLQKMGLVGGHAYTVLAVYQQPVNMLKIRNPWGEMQWKGTASDRDKQFWNEISKADQDRLGYTDKDDGVFFMLWEDFDQFFVMVDLCHINDYANYFYKELQFQSGQPHYIEFSTNGGDLTFAMSQVSRRCRKAKGACETLDNVALILGKKNGEGQYSYVCSKASAYEDEMYLKLVDLSEGKYILCCVLDTANKKNTLGTISVYTGSNVALLNSKGDEEFLAKCFLDHARQNTEGRQMLSVQPEEWVVFDVLTDSCGYGYSAFHLDATSTSKMGLEFNETEYISNGLEIIHPYKGMKKFKVICEKGQQLIVVCRLIPHCQNGVFTMPVPQIFRLK